MTQKEKVVVHVAEMIRTLGIKSVRMDDVATSLGISKRTLYEMFGDKEELLFQSVLYISEHQACEVLKTVEGYTNSLEMLFMCSSAMILNSGLPSDAQRRLVMNIRKFYPEIYEKMRIYHTEMGLKLLQGAIEKCSHEGFIEPTVDVELMTRLFFSAMASIEHDNAMVIPAEVTREEAYGALAVNFFRGISTQKGVAEIDRILSQYPRPLTLAERRNQNKENNEEK